MELGQFQFPIATPGSADRFVPRRISDQRCITVCPILAPRLRGDPPNAADLRHDGIDYLEQCRAGTAAGEALPAGSRSSAHAVDGDWSRGTGLISFGTGVVPAQD